MDKTIELLNSSEHLPCNDFCCRESSFLMLTADVSSCKNAMDYRIDVLYEVEHRLRCHCSSQIPPAPAKRSPRVSEHHTWALSSSRPDPIDEAGFSNRALAACVRLRIPNELCAP